MEDKLKKIISDWRPGANLVINDVEIDRIANLPILAADVEIGYCDVEELDLPYVKNLLISHVVKMPKINAPLLTSLSLDNIDGKEIDSLPESISFLSLADIEKLRKVILPPNLKSLHIEFCREIESFNLPLNLEKCEINHCNINGNFTIPETIKELDISNNFINSITNNSKVLEKLDCSKNRLLKLPSFLPETLKKLKCNNNEMTEIPDNLPSNLTSLNINYNKVKNIQTLPPSLKKLHCVDCGLITLPSLPSKLELLHCGNNEIISLPSLPPSILDLNIRKTHVSSITFPSNLENLNVSFTYLNLIPTLPQTLKHLSLAGLKLKVLPDIPIHVHTLDISQNSFNKISVESIASLKYFNCSKNHLTKLPTLSSVLEFLDCSNNQIEKLPKLPISLVQLNCSNNYLVKIPKGGKYLEYLNASHNLLDEFPEVKNEVIKEINVSFNKISNFTYVSSSLKFLDISFNKFDKVKDIEALPKSIENLFFDGCPVYLKMSPKLKLTDMSYIPRNFQNDVVNITTLPKGTVLFRGFTDSSKILTDFVGWHKDGMQNSYIWPNYNVFFYPYPFVVEQIGLVEKDINMVTYVLQNDVNIVLGLLPSKNSRSDRYNEGVKYMRTCSDLKVSKHFEGISYDPCLNETFLRKNKDIVGGVYLSGLDVESQKKTGSYNVKYVKYRQYFQDRSNNTGVPEVVLYPFKKRNMKEVEFDRKESREPKWLEEHIKEYNYMPISVKSHSEYSDSEFYEYVNGLLSPEGVETNLNGEVSSLHMTLDTKTHFFVMAEMATPETLKRCIPIQIKDKLDYLA